MALVSPLLVVVGSNLTIAGNSGTIKYFFRWWDHQWELRFRNLLVE